MICQICKKNEATIHFTELINGEMKEMHICEDCMLKNGIENELPFSLGDIISAITKGIENIGNDFKENIPLENPICDNCGLTIKDFIKHGRLGCAECYEQFDDALDEVIKSIQKAPNHKGKTPKFFPRIQDAKKRIHELEKKINLAIKEERYEDCVVYRDEIAHLKQAISKKNDV